MSCKYYSFRLSPASLVGRASDIRSQGSARGFETNCEQEFFIFQVFAFVALLAGRLVPNEISITFIRGIYEHRENDHLKEKWRPYSFLVHCSLKEGKLALT